MPRRNRAWSRAAAAGTRWGGHRLRGVGSIGSGSGKRSLEGLKREGAVEAGVLPSIVSGGLARVAGCRPSRSRPVSGRYLSFTEREGIAVLLARGSGVREIARRLGRAPSTISLENSERNAAIGRGRVEYRASTAQRHAERRAQRPMSQAGFRGGSESRILSSGEETLCGCLEEGSTQRS